MQQHYFRCYVAVLSALLNHNYFDHFLYLRIDGIITPRGATVPHEAVVRYRVRNQVA